MWLLYSNVLIHNQHKSLRKAVLCQYATLYVNNVHIGAKTKMQSRFVDHVNGKRVHVTDNMLFSDIYNKESIQRNSEAMFTPPSITYIQTASSNEKSTQVCMNVSGFCVQNVCVCVSLTTFNHLPGRRRREPGRINPKIFKNYNKTQPKPFVSLFSWGNTLDLHFRKSFINISLSWSLIFTPSIFHTSPISVINAWAGGVWVNQPHSGSPWKLWLFQFLCLNAVQIGYHGGPGVQITPRNHETKKTIKKKQHFTNQSKIPWTEM